MTNLLLAFPDVSFTSTIIAETSPDPDFPSENVQSGGRDERYKTLSTAATLSTVTWDAGSGNTAQPQYVILTEFHRFTEKFDVSSVIDFNFLGDDNSTFTSPETSSHTIDSTDLVGPNTEDLFVDLTADIVTAERYHRVSIDSNSDAYQHVWGKVYFGTMFDFERDPSAIRQSSLELGRSQIRIFKVMWEGITDAKRLEFQKNILALSNVGGFFLHDPIDCVLNTNRLLHVQIESVSTSNVRPDNNTIEVIFREIL
jgi:hypothetical protein